MKVDFPEENVPHDGNHRPPGDAGGERRGVVQHAQAISYVIEHPEAFHHLQQQGIFLGQV